MTIDLVTAAGNFGSGEFTKGLRQTSVRYPNGRLVHQTYGSSGSADDNLNRLLAIKDDSSGSPGASLAEYTYLGLGQVVIQDLPQPDVKLDYFGGRAEQGHRALAGGRTRARGYAGRDRTQEWCAVKRNWRLMP